MKRQDRRRGTCVHAEYKGNRDHRWANFGLHTGYVITDTTPPDQRHYRNTDVLAADPRGHWHVVSVYPVIYYPQAKECTA
jgi:hypothetical protein